jgi:hypothetical protein
MLSQNHQKLEEFHFKLGNLTRGSNGDHLTSTVAYWNILIVWSLRESVNRTNGLMHNEKHLVYLRWDNPWHDPWPFRVTHCSQSD